MSIKYYKVSLKEVSGKLKIILEDMPEVKIAVLFGSITRRNFVRDVDVGLYMDPEPDLRKLIKVAGILEDALKIPVDVVPLSKAPPKLRLKALTKGIKLVVRDSRLFSTLLSTALSETEDMDIKLRECTSMSRTGSPLKHPSTKHPKN